MAWDDADQGPELYEFVKAAIEHAILPNAAWYCWHASRRQAMVEGVWEKFGAFVHQQICLGQGPRHPDALVLPLAAPALLLRLAEGQQAAQFSDDYPSTVWAPPTVKVGKKTAPPTSKPVEVFAIPMRQHTRPGEICFEPFSGSGSQTVAGKATGHRVFAIEISPQYIDVAVRRWRTAAGKQAILDGDGRTLDEIAGERLPQAA